MKLPSIYILGAPKCGTNTLYAYLCRHPDVYAAEEKEPHFFASDIPDYRRCGTMEEYLKIYANCQLSQQAVDASVWYLYSKEAVSNIVRARVDARFLVALRNPVDAAYSLHSQLVRSHRENLFNFAEAWQAQDSRRQGIRLPPYCPAPQHLLYRDVFRFHGQLQRLINTVGRERVLVVLQEDLSRQAQAIASTILSFFDLAAADLGQLPRANSNRRVRSRTLARLLQHESPLAGNLRVVTRYLSRKFNLRIARMVRILNTVESSRPPLDPAFARSVWAEFRDDVAKLEILLQRDLSIWRDKFEDGPPM